MNTSEYMPNFLLFPSATKWPECPDSPLRARLKFGAAEGHKFMYKGLGLCDKE